MGNGKKKSSKKKKKRAGQHSMATRYIQEWFYLGSASPSEVVINEDLPKSLRCQERPVIFELHSHSTCSDGFLSPSAVVDRAYRNGVSSHGTQVGSDQKMVKVLALTDHDTMAGIPAALEVANKYGIRLIPGVEISAMFTPMVDSGKGEPVHILAYYGSCGPTNFAELEERLASIRDGRYLRVQTMLQKLKALKMPLKSEHVARIAGDGVAPGRLHVARAMVEARYVDSIKQAFSKYLYDGGPAYATGAEILAEEAIQLICRTGGVAILAHPWGLKNPVSVVRKLKAAGLHGIEVYRSDGKAAGFHELADAYQLLKLGGSDFHGRRGPDETDLGKVNIPDSAIHEFLKLAQPIWHEAIRNILLGFAEESMGIGFDSFDKYKCLKGDMHLRNNSLGDKEEIVALHLSSWLTKEERLTVEEEAVKLKLSYTVICDKGKETFVVSR